MTIVWIIRKVQARLTQDSMLKCPINLPGYLKAVESIRSKLVVDLDNAVLQKR